MSKKKAEEGLTKSKISGHIYSKNGAILNGVQVSCGQFKTLTLADGFYGFDKLRSGNYEVKVSLKGFQSGSKKVSIRDNELVNLDFYLANASGTASIKGHVYDSETGKLIMDKGTVILILPISNRYVPIDAKGYYEFNNLAEGTYTLFTSISGYDDCDTTITIANGESKENDFFCKINRTIEPAWG